MNSLIYGKPWEYREHSLKDFMESYGIAEGEILDGGAGPALKISSELTVDQVDKIHSIAILFNGLAYSSVRFINHYDSISATLRLNDVNPYLIEPGSYYIGFATLDNWFLDPWFAFKVAMAKKQCLDSIYTEERRAIQTDEILFL